MLLGPAVLALVGGTALICGVTLLAAGAGLAVVHGWNPDDWGERQLAREHRMLLVEAALQVTLPAQLVSLLLFVVTVERLHPLFTGAMCAAGTLAASVYGYPLLTVKVAVFLLCGLWLVANRETRAAAGIALVRIKHLSVPAVAAALLFENVLQIRYFTDLDPKVLTSCCASIFGEEAEGLAAGVATLPAGPSRAAFFVALACVLAAGLRLLLRGQAAWLFALLAVVLGAVSLEAVLSWVAPAYYELPTHHCPFCLLSLEAGYVGYPLYLFLAVAVVSGAGTGLVRGLRRLDPSGSVPSAAERRLCLTSMASFVLVAWIAVWPLC